MRKVSSSDEKQRDVIQKLHDTPVHHAAAFYLTLKKQKVFPFLIALNDPPA